MRERLLAWPQVEVLAVDQSVADVDTPRQDVGVVSPVTKSRPVACRRLRTVHASSGCEVTREPGWQRRTAPMSHESQTITNTATTTPPGVSGVCGTRDVTEPCSSVTRASYLSQKETSPRSTPNVSRLPVSLVQAFFAATAIHDTSPELNTTRVGASSHFPCSFPSVEV